MPVHRYTEAEFTFSLAAMVSVAAREHNLTFIQSKGAGTVLARNELATKALAWNADCILWLDSDQTFPTYTLARLLDHDLPAVGCNYVRRSGKGFTALKGGQQVAAGRGLEEVDALGFGVILIRADVFRRMSQPWFAGDGEDVFFCEKMRFELGIRPVLDHDLSAEVGHVVSEPVFLPRALP